MAAVLVLVAAWVSMPQTVGAAAASSITCRVPDAQEGASDVALASYRPINPRRVVDTRDGTGGARGKVGDGCVLRLSLADSVVPAGADAVGLSVTTIADQEGFLRVFPCRTGMPATSNVNARAGVATANMVVARPDSRDEVCIYSQRSAHVVVDLVGWWSPGPNRFASVETTRVYDTRELPGGARLPAGSVRNVQVGGGPIPLDAAAAVINFTVTDATRYGWALVYPCGQPKPLASTINFLPGESRAVAAIVGLGGSPPGQLCVTANVDIHFIVDVAGYYGPAPAFGPSPMLHPAAGERIADSRLGIGGWTTKFAAGETRRLDPVALSPLADRASAVILNVVAVNAELDGYLRVSSCDGSVPISSAVNYEDASPVSNLVAVDLTQRRDVCVFAQRATDVVVDLFGVVAAPAGSLVERLGPVGIDAWPDFHVDGSDYGVVCSAGVNRFDLEVVPLPSTRLTIDGVEKTAGLHRVSVVEDELTTVRLRRGGEVVAYHFRCLPEDFPVLEVVRPGAPAAGWYLTQFGQGNAPSGPYLVILDEFGAPVWYKRGETSLIAAARRDDGTIGANNAGQYYGTTGDDVARRTYALDGSLLEVRRPPDPVAYPADHHDFVDLAGGGGAFLSYPIRSGVDLTAIGLGAAEHVLDGAIVEIDGSGAETWRWNSADHFLEQESTFPVRWNRTFPVEGEVDLVHPNSLDVAGDGSGDYIVSARHFDAAFRVNRHADGTHADGDVEWVLGGTLPTGVPPQGTPDAPRLQIIGDPYGGPLRPHDARLRGNVLTIFDNRTSNGSGEPARAVAYRIDPVAMTATMLWQIERGDGGASPAQGSARVTPDGSVLVSWGTQQPVFEEFTRSGRRLMSIRELPTGISYRIVKYAPAAFDRAQLRNLAGGDLGVPTPP